MDELSFKEGDENITGIYLSGNETISVGGKVTKIVVVMEYGQMAGVPWLAVFEGDKMSAKYNASMIEGVLYI
jgi:hypothetical protein